MTELNWLHFGQPQDTRSHSFSCRDTISQEKEPEKMIILKIKRQNWSSSQINLLFFFICACSDTVHILIYWSGVWKMIREFFVDYKQYSFITTFSTQMMKPSSATIVFSRYGSPGVTLSVAVSLHYFYISKHVCYVLSTKK